MLTKAVLAVLCLIIFPQAGYEGQFLLPTSEQDQVIERNQRLALPFKETASLGVELEAKSAIVLDGASGKVLFAKNSQQALPMASLTKMMTAVVVLESGVDLEDTLEIDGEMVGVEGADINLVPGEEMRVGDVLHGLLISSGNDAARALAKKVGGDIGSFVEMMNAKGQAIGLKNTHFANPSGLDEAGHFSTAEDLAVLANYVYQNPVFKEIVALKESDIQSVNIGDNHHLRNTNKLLQANYSYLLGGKTGYTEEAGFCLTTFAAEEKGQHQIVTVVLGSELNGQQFQDSKALIEWTYNNYRWQ
ncbi:D-alanyl-D-alanine carboxypeptidase [Patescibacteria group bacterium]|nr:D-alanyl-D-alanine carboxypeptidase [Patescibacteria group bacterium]